MKLVVTGDKGMLGTDLMAACRDAGIEAQGLDLPELDITRDDGGFDRIGKADWLVNCAAYTDVDGAESAAGLANAVNSDGAKRLARLCRSRNIPILQVSTDYVFDGAGNTPYVETDAPNPLNVYGLSKLMGEQVVESSGAEYLIVRTQSLFGRNGRNFVKSFLARVDKGGGPVDVVVDQVSCPTWTVHLAEAILRLLQLGKRGIVHVSASGECSWYAFARAIVARVRPGTEVCQVSSAAYPRPARRPAYSTLDKTRYEEWTGQKMPEWGEGLKAYLGT